MKKKVMNKVCEIVVAVSQVGPNLCRGMWYQPQETKELKAFLEKKINNAGGERL